MTELGAAWNAANVATADQNEAGMASLGRQWVAFYEALIAGGVPRRTAMRMLERQQSTACQTQLMLMQAQTGAGR